MKIKIIMILFIIIVIGFSIFIVLSVFNKEKKKEVQDKKIEETFENYDMRKFILNELDKYDISKTKKSAIYDSLSNKIEELRDMSQQDLSNFVKDIVNDSDAFSEPSTHPISSDTIIEQSMNSQINDTFTDDDSDDDITEKYENNDNIIQKIDDCVLSLEDIVNNIKNTQTNMKDIKKYISESSILSNQESLSQDSNVVKTKSATIPSQLSRRETIRQSLRDKEKPTSNTIARGRTRQIATSQTQSLNKSSTASSLPSRRDSVRQTNQISKPILPSRGRSRQTITKSKSNEAPTNNTEPDMEETEYVDEEQTDLENVTDEMDNNVEGFKNFGKEWYSYI